ncbi:hypothetical protein [uncultured Sunxiuqinia sp.]|uniref:hypothetical protein n=1 Tax=uncultured Sunxiuqinia sp. TaxID=1573825 RepID=UPI00261EEA60|nr:hypothetical protein [uncultured Sunxiuqinia sp.]
MKNLLLLLGLLFSFTQIQATPDNLNSDASIDSIFTQNEIRDLEVLVGFFEKQISTKGTTEDLPSTYQAFFEKMAQTKKIGAIKLPLDFEEQQKIYQQIDPKTFDEIWLVSKAITHEGDTINTIQLNREGKYKRLLEALSTQNPTLLKYDYDLETAGDLSPAMVAHVIKKYPKYDISQPTVRLVLAIHYLTLNDRLKRNNGPLMRISSN